MNFLFKTYVLFRKKPKIFFNNEISLLISNFLKATLNAEEIPVSELNRVDVLLIYSSSGFLNSGQRLSFSKSSLVIVRCFELSESKLNKIEQPIQDKLFLGNNTL